MDYSDYLTHKGLRTFDPYLQSSLLPLERQEPNKIELQISNRYIVASHKIFCHICGSKKHYSGFTGEIAGGAKILFGSKCAKKYFAEEVLRAAEKSLNDREEIAHAEFKIKEIKGFAREMDLWITRSENLVKSIENAWEILTRDHKDTIEEIISHLEKNNSRLVEKNEQEISEISRSVGRSERFFVTTIICSIRNTASLKNIDNFRENKNIVKNISNIILEIKDDISHLEILEIERRLRSQFYTALENFERVMRFTVEFLTDPILTQICQWSDRQRLIKLRSQKNLSQRDLYKTITRKLGSGYELPKPMLSEIISGGTFLNNETKLQGPNISTSKSQNR